MRIEGRIEIGPYGGTSKSAREHQAFLVTEDGERLVLRRYDGPPMRDEVLERLDGQVVVADGVRRGDVLIARKLAVGDTAHKSAEKSRTVSLRRKTPRSR